MAHFSNAHRPGLASRIRDHFATRRALQQVSSLEPHLLRDIGLNPDAVRGMDLHTEAARRLLGAR